MKNIYTNLNVESEKAFGKVLRDYATFDDETFFVDDGYDAIFYSDVDSDKVIDFIVAGASDFTYALSDLETANKCYHDMVASADRKYDNSELTEERFLVFSSYDKLTKKEYFHKVRLVFRMSKYVRMDVLYRADDATRIKDVLASTIGSMDVYSACTDLILNSSLSEDTLSSILEEITKFFGAKSSAITFFINDRQPIIYPSDNGQTVEKFIAESSYATRSTWNKIIKQKGHLFIPDTEDKDIPSIVSKQWIEQGVNSVYFAPVFIGDEAVANIAVYNISENLNHAYVIRLIARVMATTIINSELQKHNYELQYRDPLTGFGSLQSFTLTVKDILDDNPNKKYALAFCDIKNFKYVNDMLGYEAGDEALRFWTGIFATCTEEDETFCRAMEDSVIVLIHYDKLSDFDDVFLKLPGQLAEFEPFIERNYRPEVVCGVYLITDNDRLDINISRWIDYASIAQKSVIKNDVNYLIFDHAMWKTQQRELDIVSSLESSLEKGDFKVFYQPQVNYRNNMLVGAECLIRWNHPELGNISPAEFIPICENHGLIPLIDRFVWEEACKTISLFKKSQDEYHLLPLSVNVSRMDFFIPNLDEVFTDLVRKYDIEPHLLRLEITESAYIRDADLLIKTVEKLQAAGFLIEMDDFGSGYSSLNSLKDVPVDVLKLDMLFLGNRRAKSEADKVQIRAEWILNAMLRMAEWIEIPTIAEGVETEEQAELLLELDCELMQGFYFYKPLPYDEFIKIVQKK